VIIHFGEEYLRSVIICPFASNVGLPRKFYVYQYSDASDARWLEGIVRASR
jgi:hypothetical protein